MNKSELKLMIESSENVLSLFEPFYSTLKIKGSNWVLTLVSNGLEFRDDKTFQETIVLLPEKELLAVKKLAKFNLEKQQQQNINNEVPIDPADDLFFFLEEARLAQKKLIAERNLIDFTFEKVQKKMIEDYANLEKYPDDIFLFLEKLFQL